MLCPYSVSRGKGRFLRAAAVALALGLLAGCGSPAVSGPEDVPSAAPEEVWGMKVPAAPAVSTVPEAPSPAAPAETPAEEPEAELPIPESPAEAETEAAEAAESDSEPPASGEDARIREILDNMTLEEKAAQLFVVTPETIASGYSLVTEAGELIREDFAAYPVGGFILMGSNLENPDQAEALLSDLQNVSMEALSLPPLLCVDEEGGTVARVSGTDGFDIPAYPDMCDIGDAGDSEAAAQIGLEMGGYLSGLGFNVDFAPVADVLTNPDNTVVRYRSFGSDPEIVAEMDAAFAEGLESQGVLAVYKHFPGHGGTAEDSHEGYAVCYDDMDTLRRTALVPFRDGIGRGLSMIMVGHISTPNATGDDLPASLSGALITDLLREEMGFDGIVITDSLGMGAISESFSSAEAAVMALEAGVDMLLMPADFSAAYQGVLDALIGGRLSEERLDASLTRILGVKLRLLDGAPSNE